MIKEMKKATDKMELTQATVSKLVLLVDRKNNCLRIDSAQNALGHQVPRKSFNLSIQLTQPLCFAPDGSFELEQIRLEHIGLANTAEIEEKFDAAAPRSDITELFPVE